jgi:hypothetical protein
MKTSGLPRHLITTAAVCAAIASAPIAGAQTTRQAAAGAYALTTDVWTCTAHEQFRMTRKGACPICGKDLVRRKVSLQGPDAVGDPYPLDTCPVSGKELGSMGDPIVMMHEGREVRLCCKGCIKTFETDAARYFKEIDQKIIEQQLPYYPVTTCVVSGEPLGSMGEPVNYVHNNRLMRLCCKGCLRALKNESPSRSSARWASRSTTSSATASSASAAPGAWAPSTGRRRRTWRRSTRRGRNPVD